MEIQILNKQRHDSPHIETPKPRLWHCYIYPHNNGVHILAPIHVDNTIAVGIVNNTIKLQRSHLFKMSYIYLLDQETQKCMKVCYHPGWVNLAEYPTKYQIAAVNENTHLYYIQIYRSPTVIHHASKPSTPQCYDEILGDPYRQTVSLHRIPNCCDLNKKHKIP